jgi:hypothetical protein
VSGHQHPHPHPHPWTGCISPFPLPLATAVLDHFLERKAAGDVTSRDIRRSSLYRCVACIAGSRADVGRSLVMNAGNKKKKAEKEKEAKEKERKGWGWGASPAKHPHAETKSESASASTAATQPTQEKSAGAV